MNLYNTLNNDLNLLDEFCEILESKIFRKVGYKPFVYYIKKESCLYFFSDNSSILQIIPDKEYQFTFAMCHLFQNEINDAIESISKKINRNAKIDILKNLR